MRRFVTVLLFLSLVLTGFAQMLPPEEPGTSVITMDVSVAISPRVKGLSWSTGKKRHEAAYAVAATIHNPPVGYGNWTYGWSFDPSPGYGTGDFDDPHAASTTARGVGPGKFLPTCVVKGTQLGPVTSGRAEGYDSRYCVAIGGPITVSVAGNEKPTYNHDRNDRTKSWYMTYYGTGEETTHDATMTIDGQPTITQNGILKGTTITWTLPGSTATTDPKTTTFYPNGSIATQPLSLLVKATGAFKDGEPKAHFHFDDGVISGDADDDSAETQYRLVDPMTQAVSWLPLVYKVSGHVPKSLVRATPLTQDEPIAQPPGYTYWTDKARIKYILRDSDDAMPGVFVQERFTDGNPLGLRTNKTDPFVWFSIRASAVDSGSVNSADGTFQGFDFLQYTWAVGDSTTKMTTHAYYGGTQVASDQATTGIPLGSATITFTAGQPGTAAQTDPVPPPPPANP